MPKKRPTINVDNGEWVTVAWRDQHEECCVCGSKHVVDHRVTEDGELQIRVVRIK